MSCHGADRQPAHANKPTAGATTGHPDMHEVAMLPTAQNAAEGHSADRSPTLEKGCTAVGSPPDKSAEWAAPPTQLQLCHSSLLPPCGALSSASPKAESNLPRYTTRSKW